MMFCMSALHDDTRLRMRALTDTARDASSSRLQDKNSLMAWDSLMDFQGAQSQKEGQEDQGKVKELGGPP